MKDLFLSRSGDSLVEVAQNANVYRLLAEHDGVNIMLNRIAANSVVWITPGDDHRYLEYYMLLSGDLTMQRGDTTETLHAGDSFYLIDFEEDISITPLTDIELLCVTSKPVFGDFFSFVNDLNSLNHQIEEKDHYTFGHCKRVMRYAKALGKRMNLSTVALHNLLLAGLYHDVGKCYIPQEILNKPGRLNDMEFAAIRRHPADSGKLLRGRFSPDVERIAAAHHERLDGSGYPQGLTADEIDLPARILAIADVFDAMTTDRPYKKGMSTENALAELKQLPHYYDPDVVSQLAVLSEDGTIEEIMRLDREGKLTDDLSV